MTKSATSVAFPTRWYEAWWTAITRPLPDAYRELLQRVNKPLTTAFLWILVVGLLSGLSRLILFVYAYFNTPVPGAALYFIAIPLQALITVLVWFALMAGVVHLAAKLLGGKGTAAETFYLKAAHVAPTLTLAILIAFLFWLLAVFFRVSIPSSTIYWVIVPVIVYQVILGYPTVKAAHDLDTAKSVIAGVVIPAALLGGLYFISTLPNLPTLFPGA